MPVYPRFTGTFVEVVLLYSLVDPWHVLAGDVSSNEFLTCRRKDKDDLGHVFLIGAKYFYQGLLKYESNSYIL